MTYGDVAVRNKEEEQTLGASYRPRSDAFDRKKTFSGTLLELIELHVGGASGRGAARQVSISVVLAFT